MGGCFFVSDLHGREDRYRKLFAAMEREIPAAVFLGGDLFPSGLGAFAGAGEYESFVEEFFAPGFERLRSGMGPRCPPVFLIPGNDDARTEEGALRRHEAGGLWRQVHNAAVPWGDYAVYGYAFVPPTPFMLKDWERYDVSRYLDPLCVAPEEGWLTVPVEPGMLKHQTIQSDLERLTRGRDLARAIFLFHAPPYDTGLDRAALDGQKYKHVQLDVHVGSIAIRRFIESRQPLVTLHGHIHESARLTGTWMERIGRTVALSAAHDGPELALVRFDPARPGEATRDLL